MEIELIILPLWYYRIWKSLRICLSRWITYSCHIFCMQIIYTLRNIYNCRGTVEFSKDEEVEFSLLSPCPVLIHSRLNRSTNHILWTLKKMFSAHLVALVTIWGYRVLMVFILCSMWEKSEKEKYSNQNFWDMRQHPYEAWLKPSINIIFRQHRSQFGVYFKFENMFNILYVPY